MAEIDLGALDEVYRVLFNSAVEGLIVCDVQGQIILVNPRAEAIFGYDKGGLVGLTIEDLVPRRYAATHEAKRSAYTQSPSQRKMGLGLDLAGLRKDGSEFAVEISLNQIELNGQPFHMALVSDITERKAIDDALKAREAELSEINEALEDRIKARTAELEESQRLYSIIARNFPNGTINVFDRELNYIFSEGKELFERGITSEKMQGTSYLKLLPESAREVIKPRLEAAFAGENSSFEIPLGEKHFILNVVGLHNADREIDQVLVVEQNITQQKLAEDNVRSALEKERELNELKGRFVSMASHEFRTPLSTILSSTSLLSKYVDNEKLDPEVVREKQHGHLKKIKTSVTNLTGILNDFLSIDKLESGKISLKLEEIDLVVLLEEVVDEVQSLLKPDQFIKTDFKLDPSLMVLDRNVIKNVLLNLLSNAVKYSSEGDQITLKAHRIGSTLQLTVEDQGIGIPKEEQKYLFDRFFRARNVTNIEGTGLGLNIVKRYVDMMDGTMKFQSTFGEGSTFRIEIPIG